VQTEVTTVICGLTEMKKLVDISGQLDTVKHIICMDDEFSSNVSLVEGRWIITSFAEVEKLGRESPVDADLPLSADIAVIMYTSGSTGLPKVSRHRTHYVIWFRNFVFPIFFFLFFLFLGLLAIFLQGHFLIMNFHSYLPSAPTPNRVLSHPNPVNGFLQRNFTSLDCA